MCALLLAFRFVLSSSRHFAVRPLPFTKTVSSSLSSVANPRTPDFDSESRIYGVERRFRGKGRTAGDGKGPPREMEESSTSTVLCEVQMGAAVQ